MIDVVGRYWHTVRHLRPVQVVGRLRYHLSRPHVDDRAAPPLRRCDPGQWCAPAPHHARLVAPHTLHVLNETRSLADGGWDDPAVDLLWRYNLHYFDHLVAASAPDTVEWQEGFIKRWIDENPPAAGTGWQPYPVSIRMVNWVKWHLARNPLSPVALHSLAVQARWLEQRLEQHLQGNHLFSNAKALVFVGLLFEGAEAERWLARGLEILAQQLDEQVLSDGGQFERSPMYHALALEDVLDLCNVGRTFASPANGTLAQRVLEWSARVPAMRAWLSTMTHPDGEISFFNDAAVGIAPPPVQLHAYAARLGFADGRLPLAATWLQASGYARVERGPAVAILDLAPVGPDHLPGHAHADTLSFELSLHGQRMVVNSGTSRYGASAERARQRGTAAHSTVVVNGVDSSEVWGGFRVARRARPRDIEVEDANGEIRVRARHDGYRRLGGGILHARAWTLTGSSLLVLDRVSGSYRHAEARYHLHPDVSVERVWSEPGGDCAQLCLAAGASVHVHVPGGTLRVEDGTWHPEFGRAIPNRCLVVPIRSGEGRVEMAWDVAP